MFEFFKLLIFSGMMSHVTEKNWGNYGKTHVEEKEEDIDDILKVEDILELDLDYDEGMG